MRSSAELHPESNSAVVTIELRDEELQPYLDQAVRKLRSQVRIPGFRKGHVPTSVLVSRIGQEAVRREAVEDAVQEHYEEVVVDNGLDVIESPSLRIVSGADEGDVTVELDVVLRPVVKVEGIGSIEIRVPRVALTDEDVDAIIDTIREQMAALNEVERPAQPGDQVTFNVLALEDETGEEEVVTPYLTARLGKGEVSPQFEAALESASIGEKVRVEPVADDESTGRATLLEILAIRELVLPELDADFVGQVSEFQTVEELREDIRNSLASRRLAEAQSAFEQQLYQKVLELAEPKTIPESLLNSAYQQELHEFGHALDGSGISLRRYLEMSQQDESVLAGQLSSKAAQSVLWDLALRAIAVDEAVNVDQEEVQAEIERLESAGALERRRGVISPLQEVQVRTSLIKQKAYKRLANIVSVSDADGNSVTLKEMGLDQLVEAAEDDVAVPVADVVGSDPGTPEE